MIKEKKQVIQADNVSNKINKKKVDKFNNEINDVNIINNVNIVYFITVLIAILGFNTILLMTSIIAYAISIFGINPSLIIDTCENILTNKLVAMLISQLLIGLPSAMYIYNRKKYGKKSVLCNKINIVTLFALVFFTYCMIPVMSFVNIFSMMFVKNQISNTIYDIIEKYPLGIALIVVAVLPAFVEELLFRGIIYNAHRQVGVFAACIMNGLLFGLLHGNFNQFAYAFLMGIVFAIVVEITGSVLSTIWCHFIINANSILMAYTSDVVKDKDMINVQSTYTWKEVICWGCFAVVCLCIAILILIFIAKYNKRYEYIKEKMTKHTKKENIRTIDINNAVKKDSQNKMIIFSKFRGLCSLALIFAIIINIMYMILIEIIG